MFALSGRFESSRILGKKLLVFADIDPTALTSNRACFMKSVSSQEAVTLEEKWRGALDYTFEGNILLHGNSDFDTPERGSKDTTGLARRFIKFPCNTVPREPNSKLIDLLEMNKLQFIVWAITCDLPCDYFLGKVPALNEILDQDIEDEMWAFVLEKVYVNPTAVTPLGAIETPTPLSLYHDYRYYCDARDYEICTWSKFSAQFLITLRSLGVKATTIRRNTGQHIQGVSLREGTRVSPPDKSFAEKLRELDPFKVDFVIEETPPPPPSMTGELPGLTKPAPEKATESVASES